jgi:hypothetical protein
MHLDNQRIGGGVERGRWCKAVAHRVESWDTLHAGERVNAIRLRRSFMHGHQSRQIVGDAHMPRLKTR